MTEEVIFCSLCHSKAATLKSHFDHPDYICDDPECQLDALQLMCEELEQMITCETCNGSGECELLSDEGCDEHCACQGSEQCNDCEGEGQVSNI